MASIAGGHRAVPASPATTLPGARWPPPTRPADAARLLGEGAAELSGVPTAAIAPRLAAELYGLEILVEDVEDHPENQTRFVAVAARGIPAPTGHDRTSIVCFQRADRPGSLHGIVGEYAARDINLTKVESRPTKRALGDYCFIFDLDGHIADEIVADCLRSLHAELAEVKFLGSYPAAGASAVDIRRDAGAAWTKAEEWIAGLRAQVGEGERLSRGTVGSLARGRVVAEAAHGPASPPYWGAVHHRLRTVRRYPCLRIRRGRSAVAGRDGRADKCAALEKP